MSYKEKIANRIITIDTSILHCLKKMDSEKVKLLFVCDDEQFIGIITIGDIQRAIIKNTNMNEKVSTILDKNKIYASKDESLESIKNKMFSLRAELMPIVDEQNNLVNVYFWEDVFGETKKEPLFRFNLPVVIMAGGLGTRLKPLTNVLPKPLIPINDKTFIEEIFERFNEHGCDTFYISVNYKAELIEYYLSKQNLPYNIQYIKEDKPMGTAGSLSLLKGQIKETLFVSNCDILIEQDYSEVLKYHRENKNEITVVAALKHYPIPYGTIETGENGKLLALTEKPEISFKINTGIYILEPHLLNEIPENVVFHMTQLIENVNKRNGRVGVFPVSEKSWKDIGAWGEYLKSKES
jgi:dTDP-glucose pyrophosphorylase